MVRTSCIDMNDHIEPCACDVSDHAMSPVHHFGNQLSKGVDMYDMNPIVLNPDVLPLVQYSPARYSPIVSHGDVPQLGSVGSNLVDVVSAFSSASDGSGPSFRKHVDVSLTDSDVNADFQFGTESACVTLSDTIGMVEQRMGPDKSIVTGVCDVRGYSSGSITFHPGYESERLKRAPGFYVPNDISALSVPSGLSSRVIDWPSGGGAWLISYLEIHKRVVVSGVPNFVGCRIAIPSGFKIDRWRDRLSTGGYTDMLVCELLEFGFPIGYSSDTLPIPSLVNHSKADAFPEYVDKFVRKELTFTAMLGPFTNNPLSSFLSLAPINTTEKKGSIHDRRIIVDFSWPIGHSVNDGINKNVYLGDWVQVTYPSVDRLLDRVVQLGPGCLLFKADLSRAYRQIGVCPGDLGFLGFSWRGRIFIDRVLPFGLRSAALCCQRVTDAIAFLIRQDGYFVINYIDDFGGVDTPGRAGEAFACLRQVLLDLGVDEAVDKAVEPSTTLVFLGVLIDTVNMTVSVTCDRMLEVTAELDRWLGKHGATKREVQSLIGKLQFVARCVRSGRVFISRMLMHLRRLYSVSPRVSLKLPQSFLLDVCWWRRFMNTYNGVSFIPQRDWSLPDEVISTDACLTGCGGVSSVTNEYFHTKFPDCILDSKLDINSLELLTILVALRVWGQALRGKRIQLLCDNNTSVIVLNSGRTRDSFLSGCLREIIFIAASCELEIHAVHISGVSNRRADLLSRCHLNGDHLKSFLSLMEVAMFDTFVPHSYFDLSSSW